MRGPPRFRTRASAADTRTGQAPRIHARRASSPGPRGHGDQRTLSGFARHPQSPPRIAHSGHVYDVVTGMVETIVPSGR